MKKKHQQRLPHYLANNSVLISIAIIISSLIISLGILYVSSGLHSIFKSVSSILPQIPEYTPIMEISDYTNIENVFNSQPKMSYNREARYLLVEISDLDCVNCARFHGFQKNNKSSFEKFLEDFVRPGLLSYMFIDSQSIGEISKHMAIYCAGEQKTRSFFDYKSLLYKNYEQKIDEEKLTAYASKLNLKITDFQNCLKSGKYKERIDKLTTFAQNVLAVTGTPTFILYKVETQKVIDQNEKRGEKKIYIQIDQIKGNVDYDTTFYPFLKKYILNL